LAALAVTPAGATDLDVSSAVDAVTVYPDGASVTRVITLDLPAGDNTLVAKDFPLTLDPTSLRVEGEGGAKLTIGAIDTRQPHPPRRAPPPPQPSRNSTSAPGRGRRTAQTGGAQWQLRTRGENFRGVLQKLRLRGSAKRARRVRSASGAPLLPPFPRKSPLP